MSLPVGQITCTNCSFEQSLVHCPVTVRYQIDSDHYIDHYQSSAWCTVCQRVQDVEDIPKLVAIDADIAEATQHARETVLDRFRNKVGLPVPSERVRARELLKCLERKKEWVRHRRSPPRCLTCGKAELLTVDWEQGDGETTTAFRHQCGGRLVLSYPRRIYYNVAPRCIVLDSEGEYLGVAADVIADESVRETWVDYTEKLCRK